MSTDAQRIEQLNRTADALADIVQDLTDAVAGHHRKIRWTRGLVALNLVLSLAFGWMFYQNHVLRSEVLCPLYSVLANSYNPTGPSAKALGSAAYDANFRQIQRQYQALDCATPYPASFPR